jgi:hypothetical protein
MREFRLFVLLATLLLPACLFAQHGSSENGMYPIGYHGDTWNGVVSSISTETRGVTLVYTQKGKTTIFEGTFSKACRMLANDPKQKKQLEDTGVAIGSHIRVYYMPNQTTDELNSTPTIFKAFSNNLLDPAGGTTKQFNLIFLVLVLPEEGEIRTGTVISTNDSTREIVLATADSAKNESFIGVVVDGYQFKMKDGNFHDLVVSQIPSGTKLTVHYFDEMTGADRKTGEVHRIYRLEFPASPQTP